MLFSNLTFLYIFLPLLVLLYFVRNDTKYRQTILVIFSLIFYAWGEPIYVLLMIFVVFINFFFGKRIGLAKSKNNKKIYLIIAVVLNILILVFFKYTNMIIDTINAISHKNIQFIQIVLPLGISFYIFQALSYTIDVYRNDAKYQKSFSQLLLYVSFFPQLVAGPIVRYKDIMMQLRDRTANIDVIHYGTLRFSIGLAKKTLLANNLGLVVDSLYKSTNFQGNFVSYWLGAIFFSLQIYLDFSAYSDMAIGLGAIFGFYFKENFNYPYISSSVTEFWRRWHISLSTFFRDYVYIPLGGKYKYQIRNIIIVWFLTGLWHGASWNFVLWGLYYAFFLIIEKYILQKLLRKLPIDFRNVIGCIYVITITLVGFTIFYFTDFSEMKIALSNMFMPKEIDFNNLYVTSIFRENVILLIVAIIASTPIVRNLCVKFEKQTNENIVVILKTVVIIVFLVLSTACLVGESYNPFLYFRF